MKYGKYPIIVSKAYTKYEFFSEGSRGSILKTVIYDWIRGTAIDFTNKFPGAIIYTEGSTPARTRLYQIGIANSLEEITENFEIEGYRLQTWEPFQKGHNYEAFLARRK